MSRLEATVCWLGKNHSFHNPVEIHELFKHLKIQSLVKRVSFKRAIKTNGMVRGSVEGMLDQLID